MNILRNIFAVVIGVLVGGLVNMLFVQIGPSIIPPPAGVDSSSAESIASSIHLYEAKHFITPFLAHAVGTFVGACLAYMIAANRNTVCAYIVGAMFLAGGITAAQMIPAPTWFIALDLIVAYMPMAWLGIKMVKRFQK